MSWSATPVHRAQTSERACPDVGSVALRQTNVGSSVRMAPGLGVNGEARAAPLSKLNGPATASALTLPAPSRATWRANWLRPAAVNVWEGHDAPEGSEQVQRTVSVRYHPLSPSGPGKLAFGGAGGVRSTVMVTERKGPATSSGERGVISTAADRELVLPVPGRGVR